jgi:hypothetical protein
LSINTILEVSMADTEHPKAHITFEGPKIGKGTPAVTISGVAAKDMSRPEKIKKLMDLLELPEGTNARVVYSTDDVIVR